MSMKQIVILSGSPKPAGTAASDKLAGQAAEALSGADTAVRVVNVNEALTRKQTPEAFALMAAADAILVIFPLYIFCLPGMLMRFLQQYKAYMDVRPGAQNGAAVYAVVNCGFPEPEINGEAVQVIGRFAAAVGARFRFGVMIGGGPMVTADIPPVHKLWKQYAQTMARVREDIMGDGSAPVENVMLRVAFPRKLYFMGGNIGWESQIRKNGGTKQDLYARPYQS